MLIRISCGPSLISECDYSWFHFNTYTLFSMKMNNHC